MKVLVGVCGIGLGHSIRQQVVVEHLIMRGHQVVLFLFWRSLDFYSSNFPDLPKFEVSVPWIFTGRDGIDFQRSAAEPANIGKNFFATNFVAMNRVREAFGGDPDVVISDYEPVAAQMAYAVNAPLVTIDQQSKFLGYDFPPINGYSRNEERSRLSLFFPSAKKRFASSFYRVPYEKDREFQVEIVPPIIRSEFYSALRSAKTSNQGAIIVYLSTYGPTKQTTEEIVSVLKELPRWQFILFAPEDRVCEIEEARNIRFAQFDAETFVDAVLVAPAVICTAGHTLLSELLILGKPVFAIPLPTYDQRFCAQFTSEQSLGLSDVVITKGKLKSFLDSLAYFRERITTCTELICSTDGLKVLSIYLEREFGL